MTTTSGSARYSKTMQLTPAIEQAAKAIGVVQAYAHHTATLSRRSRKKR